MTEEKSPTLVLTVPKDKVKIEGEFAVINVGLTVEEFILCIVKYTASPEHAVAVLEREENIRRKRVEE